MVSSKSGGTSGGTWIVACGPRVAWLGRLKFSRLIALTCFDMATTLEICTHASVVAQREAVNLLDEQVFPSGPKNADGNRSGTHDGAFQGVPAMGKHYELAAMTVWRLVDGKIAEEWLFSNDLDLYRQLGLFKDPGSTDH